MTKNKFHLIYLLLLIPLALTGQRYISGQIIDAEDNQPLPYTTVFISNTTLGTSTDNEGNYRLQIPGEGSYQLTVSFVGYQRVYKDIEPGNTSIVFNAALQVQELEEVMVSVRVRFRQRDINLFWNKILGRNPSRRTIQATNPEVVYYYYNAETGILKVTCREPLQIVNYETGYQIQYVLDHFTHDYNTETTDWSYQCNFTELTPENPGQQNNWEQKRENVYHVSLTKFIKSMYNNTLFDDGFVLATYQANPYPGNSKQSYYPLSIGTNRTLTPNITDKSKTLSFLDEKVMLICLGRPGNKNDLGKIQNMQANDLLKNREFIISQVFGSSIRIYPDGTYVNKLGAIPVNTSNSHLGLSMKLPLEYVPDGSTSLATTDALINDISAFDRIVQQFDDQLSIFPQEKIHLHTDRDVYVSGEKIWFKAYVVDALTHQYSTPSRYVYVELTNSMDTLVNRVMVRPVDGIFYGHLPLIEYVPTGNYTLRAYTRHMENLGDDYFFKKNIRIENLDTKNNQQRPIASRNMLKDDYEVSFFPEGGNLPEGVLSRVAFKAININGYPDIVSGSLIDEDGVEIAAVETLHAGMGVFEYMPEVGKKIYLQCKNINGLEKQIELPQPNPQACALSASLNDNDLLIEIKRAVHAPDIPCYLLAHNRGRVLYFSEWENEDGGVVFDADGFPAGIIQFVLFDEQMNPLSERLVFSKNQDDIKVAFQTDKESYTKREKVVSTLSIPPTLSGKAGEGIFSVAITDDKDIAIDSLTTILSSLLLSSELRGYIENPAYYLQDNTQSAIALDYLMMTHGWRRYNIPDVVRNNATYPQIPFQMGQEMSGQVNSLLPSRPIADSEVIVMVKGGDIALTSTDKDGKFMFQYYEYPDSTSFFIQAQSSRGSDRVELVLDEERFPKPIHATQSPLLTPTLSAENASEPDAFIEKAEQYARYDEDMRMVLLDEVVVTGSRIQRDRTRQIGFNASSDVTLLREEFESWNFQNFTDLLQQMAGISISGGEIMIRGKVGYSLGSFDEEGELIAGSIVEQVVTPLIVIDGIPMPREFFGGGNPAAALNNLINIHEVESVDVFKGASAAIYGMQGGNGVISITTRRADPASFIQREQTNITAYTPLGYQKPVEFYSPNYETLEARYLTIPDYRTTIFWKPDVIVSENENEATFEFFASDFPATYSVVIEGLTKDGRIVRQVEKIRVE